jgi:hypothetical protein
MSSKMLKKSASGVLGLSKFSTYPTRRISCLGSLGWVGGEWYASGFDSPAALLNGLFEHPARSYAIVSDSGPLDF